MRIKIGARTRKSILADPLATEEEIRELPGKDAMTHPNCPPDLWWRMAAIRPIEAMKSPAYDLMMLESPERWVEIEKERVLSWVENFTKDLSAKDARLFAADCAEHVLPAWVFVDRTDKRPQAAIAAARAYAEGKSSKAKLAKAYEDAKEASLAQNSRQAYYNPQNTFHVECRRAYSAAVAAYLAAGLVSNLTLSVQHAVRAVPQIRDEGLWQWHRLVGYLMARP